MRKRICTGSVTSSRWFAAAVVVALASAGQGYGQEAVESRDEIDSIVLKAPANESKETVEKSESLEDLIPTEVESQTDAEPADASDAKVDADEEAVDVFADPTSGNDAATQGPSAAGSDDVASTELPPPAPINDSGTTEITDDSDVPEGVEPLLRGPVHEAFAEPLQLDVKPSPVVPKAPPEPIEELPPEIDPESGAVWISGYWAWDEDRGDFIWVSGVWRKQPKDRIWTPGKWVEVDGGVQWVAGFWAHSVNANKVQVLPTPPQTLEQGPTVAQPSDDHFWIPGNWQYRNTRYVWRPGFWSPCHQNWVWVPEHYSWHPQGCVHVAGYWDYHWNNRGTLFAPTYFNSSVYRTAGYRYRPSIVVSLGSAFDHLWIRPGYSHYFIGDYYTNYSQRGFIPWYSYASRTRYYDPLFAYQRWALRNSIHDLHHHYHQRHNHYHRHVGHRPFHTYRDYRHHYGRYSRVTTTGARRATQTGPPSRLTGSAFVSRVDQIVRQQSRNRHGANRGSQIAINRGGNGGNANANRNRSNGNRGANILSNGSRNGAGRNVAASNANSGVRSVTNQPKTVTKVNPSNTRSGRSANVAGPNVRPNPAIVNANPNGNRNNGNRPQPNVQSRRPAPSRTTGPSNRTLVTKPRVTPNTSTAKPRVTSNGAKPRVTTPNNSRNNATRSNPFVTRPRVTRPNSNQITGAKRNIVNRGVISNPRATNPSRSVGSAVNSSQRRPSQTITNNQSQRPVQSPRVQTPRPNTTTRSNQYSRSRTQPSNTNRVQSRAQQLRTQSFRPPVSRPPTVSQPSVRNVRPNVRSTPQRSMTPQRNATPSRSRTPQRVTPQRVQPQRSFQRSTPQRSVRPAPRPSYNSNRGAGFSRSRAPTPRSIPSRSSGANRGRR